MIIPYNKIFEGKQVGILYHFTYRTEARKILSTGLLKPTDETSKYSTPESIDYVSFTRNFDLTIFGPIRFIFDGNKLSMRYKIEPFLFSSLKTARQDTQEFEERIKGPVKIIPFLLGIDVESSSIHVYDALKIQAEKLNIPFNVVDKFRPYKK